LGILGYNGDRTTVVWCHSNRLEGDMDIGIKARNEESCYDRSTFPVFRYCVPCSAWRLASSNTAPTARSTGQALLRHKDCSIVGDRIKCAKNHCATREDRRCWLW
jgi:hypothetical protein